MNTYTVTEYDADGHTSPPESLHRSTHATLTEAREQVRRLLGESRLPSDRLWHPDGAMEAYHMVPDSHPDSWGCGGYVIQEADE